MIVYVKEADGVITNISTEVIEASTPIEIDSLKEMEFTPGHDKKLINGKLIDVENTERLAIIAAESAKQVKVNKVSWIKVTTTLGKTFDGDEKSQDRMTRAINIAAIAAQTETQWKLADNTIVEVTVEELKEALALAGQEMSRIWLEN